MTYIRYNLEVDANQIRPQETLDMVWVTTKDITIINIYRDPTIQESLSPLFN